MKNLDIGYMLEDVGLGTSDVDIHVTFTGRLGLPVCILSNTKCVNRVQEVADLISARISVGEHTTEDLKNIIKSFDFIHPLEGYECPFCRTIKKNRLNLDVHCNLVHSNEMRFSISVNETGYYLSQGCPTSPIFVWHIDHRGQWRCGKKSYLKKIVYELEISEVINFLDIQKEVEEFHISLARGYKNMEVHYDD